MNGQKWWHLKLASYWALEWVCQTWQGELLQSPGEKLFQAEMNQDPSEAFFKERIFKRNLLDEPGCKGVDCDPVALPTCQSQ